MLVGRELAVLIRRGQLFHPCLVGVAETQGEDITSQVRRHLAVVLAQNPPEDGNVARFRLGGNGGSHAILPDGTPAPIYQNVMNCHELRSALYLAVPQPEP